jgi:hypothetical protein
VHVVGAGGLSCKGLIIIIDMIDSPHPFCLYQTLGQSINVHADDIKMTPA